MFLAKVEGAVVATKKDPSMSGRKLLLLRPQLVDDQDPHNSVEGKTPLWQWTALELEWVKWCCSVRAAVRGWHPT